MYEYVWICLYCCILHRPASFSCSSILQTSWFPVSFHTRATTLVIRLRSFKVSLQHHLIEIWKKEPSACWRLAPSFPYGFPWFSYFLNNQSVAFQRFFPHRVFDGSPAVPSSAGAECCDLWHFAPQTASFDSRRKTTWTKQSRGKIHLKNGLWWYVMISNLLLVSFW